MQSGNLAKLKNALWSQKNKIRFCRMSDVSSIRVGMLTSGGLASCLASSVAHLIHYWSEAKKAGKISDLSIRLYRDGYKGLLTGDSFEVTEDLWEKCTSLHDCGGSPIGNSRVKVCISWCKFWK